MKRQRASVAGLFGGRDCLGRICGTNIDTEDVKFARQQPNLTYIDKVFSYNKDTASPILFSLSTGGTFSDDFVTELYLDGGCFIPCILSPNAVFEIENTFAAVEYFNTRPPGNINSSQVTLNGFPVDSVCFANGQYTARTENVLPRVQRDRCLDKGLATKVFFLISNAGPWNFRATYVLEGTVNTNGRRCRFRAVISNAPDSPNSMLPVGSLSSFAINHLSLPCSINGIAPEILFQFSAKINLVNPRLLVNCESYAVTNPCTVILESNVAVEPVVHVQAVRRTLFCINACEGLQPCDGSLLAAAIEDTEDCAVGGVDRPDCRCSNHKSGGASGERGATTEEFTRRSDDSARGAVDNTQNQLAGIYGIGNVDINGVTIGTGTCEDCVWGETEGHDCKPCKRGRQFRSDGEDLADLGDRGRLPFGNEVLGETDRNFIRKLVNEIREELSEDTDDVAGIGFGPNGTFGIDEEEAAGLSERLRNTARTASRRNGCNGCSW